MTGKHIENLAHKSLLNLDSVITRIGCPRSCKNVEWNLSCCPELLDFAHPTIFAAGIIAGSQWEQKLREPELFTPKRRIQHCRS